ncbi:MAG: ImmA/IrrE family metallo-endopeptidase [Pelagimonas sp.]|jgi:hypothetical protein|nr:ImmA/IrrE family metallo-endopeptidase [Pelagimonas sp.]
MPRAYPSYPFVEARSPGYTDDEIEQAVEDMLSQNPQISIQDGGPLDSICRALNVDVEYALSPSEILIEAPLDRRAVIWLPNHGKTRHDRLTLATGIGHWLLHVPFTREAKPSHGIQALARPSDPAPLEEARRFGRALLMPIDLFTALWFEGRAQLVAETLNVPTQSVYDRAKDLTLEFDNVQAEEEIQKAEAPAPSGGSGLARRIG